MERAGRLLGRALRRLERPEAAIAWLRSAWAEIVGEALAAHVRPVSCEAGHLKLAADSKEWMAQIQGMKSEFCAQINCAWGGDLVRDVSFVDVRPASAPATTLRPVSHELDNNHIPFVRRRSV